MAKVIPVEFPAILNWFFSPVLLYHESSKRGGGWQGGQEIDYKMVVEGTRSQNSSSEARNID